MFRWAASGITPFVISSCANALGWITGDAKPWAARQVLAILTNQVYAGLVQGLSPGKGCHQPLIDRELYGKAQNFLIGRRTRTSGRQKSGAGITRILRGLLHCGSCGRLMRTHSVRSGSVVRCYYRCRSTAGGWHVRV